MGRRSSNIYKIGKYYEKYLQEVIYNEFVVTYAGSLEGDVSSYLSRFLWDDVKLLYTFSQKYGGKSE